MSTPNITYNVPKKVVESIFEDKILNSPEIGFDKAASVTQPRGVMLAGQPGAGKSAVKNSVLTDFGKDGGVVIDPDELLSNP